MYTVIHYVHNEAKNCFDSSIQEINVTTVTCNALFSYHKENYGNNLYYFNSQSSTPSEMINNWQWTIDSQLVSTTIDFATTLSKGNHSVCLTISTSDGCSSSYCQDIYVQDTIPYIDTTAHTCNASFNYSRDSTNNIFYFSAESSTPTGTVTGWQWTINNQPVASIANFSKRLSRSNHSVCLTISTSEGCSSSYCQDIYISDSSSYTDTSIHTCNASIGYYRHGEYDSKKFSFYSNSNATDQIDRYEWTIDGNIVSTQSYFTTDVLPDINHTIFLKINTSGGCSSYDSVNIFVADTLYCNKNLSFATIVSPTDKTEITFVPNQNYIGIKYRWELDDWNNVQSMWVYSEDTQPTHKYNRGGKYSVKLTVYDSITNCVDSVRQTIDVFDTCSTLTASFNYTTAADGTVSFTAQSNQSIAYTTWYIYSKKFNDTTNTFYYAYDTSIYNTVTNLVYNFKDSGYKHVYLYLRNDLDCSESYDTIIYVNKLAARPVDTKVLAYPNPVTGRSVSMNIQLDKNDKIQYQVYNLNGNIVYQNAQQGFEGDNKISIPVNDLNKGQYFVKIIYGDIIKNSIFQKL